MLLPIGLAGGLVGAILLLVTPGGAFDLVIPWLLLLATLTFLGGRHLGDWLRRYVRIGRPAFLVIQFILSIYGGYFGGAIGLMMMAVWTLIDTSELKAMAPTRTALVSAANGAAVLCFAVAGAVWWPEMLAMMVSAIAGGYYGARFARHLPPPVLRWFVVALSATVTVVFFHAAVLLTAVSAVQRLGTAPKPPYSADRVRISHMRTQSRITGACGELRLPSPSGIAGHVRVEQLTS